MSLFSSRLKQLRIGKGETQDSIAEYLGITRSAYSGYERGITVPPYKKAKKLADRFGVNIDYLMGKSSDPIKGAASYGDDMDLYKCIMLVSDMLSDENYDFRYKGIVLSETQKKNILSIVTNALDMIEVITEYE